MTGARRGWLVIGISLLAVTLLLAAADSGRDPMQHFFHPSSGNLPQEVATARAAGQQGILVMFVSEDCSWCAKMKASVLNQPAVQDYYRKYFRVLEMDVNRDAPITDFNNRRVPEKEFAFRHNRKRATPVFAFFDLDGKLMTGYAGATADSGEFLEIGEYVVSGAWKDGTLTAWRRARAAAGNTARP